MTHGRDDGANGPTPRPLEAVDVMILAAGLGTRMFPLTKFIPKPLLPVLGRPLLIWSLRELASQGAKRVVVNVHHLAHEMQAYVENELPREFADPTAPPKPEVRLVREVVLLGTGGGIGNAAPLLRSDTVLVWNVDLIYRPNLGAALALHQRENALATLVLTRSPMHAKIAIEGTRIRSVAEEADPADSSLRAYTGVMFLSQEALRELPSGQFDELPPRLRAWAAGGRLHGYEENAPFLEVGSLESYLRVHRRLAESPELLPGAPPRGIRPVDGFGYVDKGATIEGDAHEGDAHEGATIEGDAHGTDAHENHANADAGLEIAASDAAAFDDDAPGDEGTAPIGNTGARQARTTIEDSVVLRGARVRSGAVVRRSILGPNGVAIGEVFGACLTEGLSQRFASLDRRTESEFLGFLDRHAKIWPKESRRESRTLLPLHGDGSGRRLVRVVAGAHSHILVAPAPTAAVMAQTLADAVAPGDARPRKSPPGSSPTDSADENAGTTSPDAQIPIYPRRIGPDVPDEPTTFVYVAGILSRRGIRVPEIRVHEETSGLLLVEDLGDRTLHAATRAGTPDRNRELYRDAVNVLVRMQRHTDPPFDPERVQSPSYSREFALTFECGYFQREFVEGYLGQPPASSPLQAEYESIAGLAADGTGSVLIHRDFQSRNIMVTPRGLVVIDFQGARLGPPFYDLASLLYDPYVDLDVICGSRTIRDELIQTFIRHTGIGPSVQRFFAPTALCRLLQALGAFGYLGGRLGRPGFLECAPSALRHVATLAGEEYPNLARLAQNLAAGASAVETAPGPLNTPYR